MMAGSFRLKEPWFVESAMFDAENQIVTTAMDEVRKREQRDVNDKKSLFQSSRLFMVPKSKLTDEQAANLAVLSRRFPKTGKACRIVASLDDFYRSATPKEADGAFKRLYSWMRRCRLEPNPFGH